MRNSLFPAFCISLCFRLEAHYTMGPLCGKYTPWMVKKLDTMMSKCTKKGAKQKNVIRSLPLIGIFLQGSGGMIQTDSFVCFLVLSQLPACATAEAW
jgi:hypothetical protein